MHSMTLSPQEFSDLYDEDFLLQADDFPSHTLQSTPVILQDPNTGIASKYDTLPTTDLATATYGG